MKQHSLSVSKGGHDPKHNTDAKYRATLENVVASRTWKNDTIIDRPIEELYQELFSEALERYNAGQSRDDRKIDDYYKHIENSKQEKAVHEICVQIGDRDTNPATDNANIFGWKQIFPKYVERFKERFPNLAIHQAVSHVDESTPHGHIAFVPWAAGCTRGLDTRNSLNMAMEAMGFKGQDKFKQMQAAMMGLLEEVAEEYGVTRLDMACSRGHLNVRDYKAAADSLNMPNVDSRTLQLYRDLDHDNKRLQSALESLETDSEPLRYVIGMEEAMKRLEAILEAPERSFTDLKEEVRSVLRTHRELYPPKSFFERVKSVVADIKQTLHEKTPIIRDWISSHFAPVSDPAKVDTPNTTAYTREWKQPAPEYKPEPVPIEEPEEPVVFASLGDVSVDMRAAAKESERKYFPSQDLGDR